MMKSQKDENAFAIKESESMYINIDFFVTCKEWLQNVLSKMQSCHIPNTKYQQYNRTVQ